MMSHIVEDEVRMALDFTRTYGPQAESHGYQHHVRVVENARTAFNIMGGEPDEEFVKNVLIACAIHDCVDHKYPEIAEMNAVRIEAIYGADMLTIVNNMSWSKHVTLEDPELEAVKLIAQNADWVDAIDLPRCIKYTEESNMDVSDALDHYHDKLKFIYGTLTPAFQKFSLDAHKQMLADYDRISRETNYTRR